MRILSKLLTVNFDRILKEYDEGAKLIKCLTDSREMYEDYLYRNGFHMIELSGEIFR
jgi:hypothetical protein